MSNEALRRAAILIASLDTHSADALLDEMSHEQAALIRNAVMELEDIDRVEQQQVIQQFMGKKSQPMTCSDAGSSIIPDLARKLNRDPNTTSNSNANSNSKTDVAKETPEKEDNRPFAFLDSVESADLARVLLEEHPQTVAIVVAHLAPGRAADVLGHMPCRRQTDALMRIARLNVPHPDVIQDLEHEMHGLLVNRGLCEPVGADGVATVTAILHNTAGTARRDLVADLAQQDKTLSKQLRFSQPGQDLHANEPADGLTSPGAERNGTSSLPSDPFSSSEPDPSTAPKKPFTPGLEFSDLEHLDGSALLQILNRCPPTTTLLALVGASRKLVERISEKLPKKEAAQLEQQLQGIGPLRLDDVQRAQQKMSEVARQLIDEGCLNPSQIRRLSVAA
ncbi:MAG: FliG C-terminal domain-containing protein [Planctomycetota bacterium]